ncbi:MAG: biotin-dependent carboxyltransferase family protein [Sporomusaceae bacterium]|nr:biotin-dependent carboxyltransferase family protein [Sporomusaceae bacterium]
MGEHLVVHSSGFASVQDLGRPGYLHYGISSNGAMDQYAYLWGNEQVGNASAQPSIEITAFGFAMSSSIDIPICITGAPADLTIDAVPIDAGKVVTLPAGKILSVENIRQGLRVYIAVAGGIEAPAVLGSCAIDTVGMIGERLRPGQQLPLKSPPPVYGSPWTLRVCDGCNADIFRNHLEQFYHSDYTVAADSNHVGVRLEGQPIVGHQPTEVISRGVCAGSIQIVPAGTPIILLKGRGGTAGYPIIAVVAAVDMSLFGQVRPGDTVRFNRISIDEAIEKYRQRFSAFKSLKR